MSPITRVIAATAVLVASLAGVAVAQNYSLAPAYGTMNLTAGFSNDPRIVAVRSGGTIDAAALMSRPHVGTCTGGIANAPDVRLNYTAGTGLPLIISVSASADTTLVVNAPDGNWYCDDDGGVNGLNPALRFTSPPSGQYDIWIGTYNGTAQLPAQLYVSELTSQ